MKGTVRVLDMALTESVKTQISCIVTSIAAAWGAEAEVELADNYPALINDRTVTMAVAMEAARILGEENIIYSEAPSMGADDFAYFANAARGCYFNIGTAEAGHLPQSLHSETFAPNEECILIGLALITAGALKLLEISL